MVHLDFWVESGLSIEDAGGLLGEIKEQVDAGREITRTMGIPEAVFSMASRSSVSWPVVPMTMGLPCSPANSARSGGVAEKNRSRGRRDGFGGLTQDRSGG